MKRVSRSMLMLAGSLALAASGVVTAAAPAAALPPLSSAYGSQAPMGSFTGGPNGLAESPPADTEVANNVNINGLLSTGTATDTAGTNWASAKVAYPLASTSWTAGLTTYSLSLSANQVTSSCNGTGSSAGLSASIISGVLTETARTGATVTSQVLNLPRQPAVNQLYGYQGASVVLNNQTALVRTLDVEGITVETPAQTLSIAAASCHSTHCPPGARAGWRATVGAPAKGVTTAARPVPICAIGPGSVAVRPGMRRKVTGGRELRGIYEITGGSQCNVGCAPRLRWRNH
jgi:hypothetical protein